MGRLVTRRWLGWVELAGRGCCKAGDVVQHKRVESGVRGGVCVCVFVFCVGGLAVKG